MENQIQHETGTPVGVPPQAPGSGLDWRAAQLHLESVERAYRMLVGLPGVNASFMFRVLDGIRTRFNNRDRSPELYAEIMALKE